MYKRDTIALPADRQVGVMVVGGPRLLGSCSLVATVDNSGSHVYVLKSALGGLHTPWDHCSGGKRHGGGSYIIIVLNPGQAFPQEAPRHKFISLATEGTLVDGRWSVRRAFCCFLPFFCIPSKGRGIEQQTPQRVHAWAQQLVIF